MKRFFAIFNLILLLLTTSVYANEYQLEQVVIFSRHGVRSPTVNGSSVLGKISPNKWFNWTANAGELSLRGGIIETAMGQFFRKKLVKENFMTENYVPSENEFRFYANSMQRTIATTHYFSSGLLPIANVDVEHKEIGTLDKNFSPVLNFTSETYNKKVLKEIKALGIPENLKDILASVEEIIDFKNSEMYKEGSVKKFSLDDQKFIFKTDEKPQMNGSLRLANSAVDAITQQYYESGKVFEKCLSEDDLKKLRVISDFRIRTLYNAPSISINVAHDKLKLILEELENSERRFSFLCGHDSNISSILAALDVESYELPNAIEQKTPIGVKMVFEKWRDSSGQKFVTVNLVYASVDQLRNLQEITLDNPPQIFPLKFKGLKMNQDNLYLYDDLKARFNEKISAYDEAILKFKD